MPDKAKRNILFIDDNPSREKLIRAAFERYGKGLATAFVPSCGRAVETLNSEKSAIDLLFISTQCDVESLKSLLKDRTDGRDLPFILMAAGEDSAPSNLLFSADACVSTGPKDIDDYPSVAARALARHDALGRLKDALYHTHSRASLGLLVSGVAHEINNPLTAVIAYSEMAGMKAVDEDLRQDLDKIAKAAERCKKIIDNLRNFARPRGSSKSLESINDIIDRTIDLRNYRLAANKIEVVREFGAFATVLADAQQVQYAVLHIFLNAEQAIAGSGRSSGKIAVITQYNQKDRIVSVKIADNGSGIPKDIMPRIFDPFFTTRPEAAGLGLSIARRIILEHGGTIQAKNREGGGAEFSIELPTGVVRTD